MPGIQYEAIGKHVSRQGTSGAGGVSSRQDLDANGVCIPKRAETQVVPV